jgi:hypothetical protein
MKVASAWLGLLGAVQSQQQLKKKRRKGPGVPLRLPRACQGNRPGTTHIEDLTGMS